MDVAARDTAQVPRVTEETVKVTQLVPQERVPERTAEDTIDVLSSASDARNDRSCEAHPTRLGADSRRGENRGRASATDSSTIRRSPQGHPRVSATVAQMRRAMMVAHKQSKNTFTKMCTRFGKVGSEIEAPAHTPAPQPERHVLEDEQPANMVAYTWREEGKTEAGGEVAVMGAFRKLKERSLEQSLAVKREVPSDIQELWQLVENLREEMQRLEEETKLRFTVTNSSESRSAHLVLPEQ